MKKYFFKSYHRNKWGDSYTTQEIIINARSMESAESKALEAYKDIHHEQWEGEARIELERVEA